jgi:arginyl-tRNA synthetase|uniref:Arginine--tRNA ligase n=1 Tax=Mesoaciditoga lauensis TaxID=1495039 RepID=A0A7V3RE70_9BACT
MDLKSMIKEKVSKKYFDLFGSEPKDFVIEIPPENFGDYSTNVAMVNAKILKLAPKVIAQKLIDSMAGDLMFEKCELANPGFINFTLSPVLYRRVVDEYAKKVDLPKVKPQKVQFEFVSANPTGPLTVGHGRQAIIGDILSKLNTAVGNVVTKEYYFNDAGRQVKMLGHSTWIRYNELFGRKVEFEEDDYVAGYLIEIAEEFSKEYGDKYVGLWNDEIQTLFSSYSTKKIFEWIKLTLDKLGVNFDLYFSERSLYDEGFTKEAFEILKKRGYIYEKDDSVWFAVSKVLQNEEDRVIIRKNGDPTYFFSDIAYMMNKYRRGFDKVYYIWGADHHGYIPRMEAASKALGIPDGFFNVILHQFVTLKSGEEIVRMSKRHGEFVTLNDLIEAVGVDATRYFFAMMDPDTQLVFDVELAKSKKMDNPVYYIQYAHARIKSLMKNAVEKGIEWENSQLTNIAKDESSLVTEMEEFQNVVLSAVKDQKPQKLCNYAYSLSEKFHSYYNDHRIVDPENLELSKDRLKLCTAVNNVLEAVLSLIGVSAPDEM